MGCGSIKKELFDKLLIEMSNCNFCENLKSKNIDKSLINIYKDEDFSKNIPSIWTDWYNRLDSEIMLIGQDWGPFKDMEKLYKKYKSINNWKKLIEEEKSLTKRQLTKFVKESSKGRVTSLDNFYITNAIMCARNGDNYRSNNINLKKSTLYCTKFLKEQIEIVKPKIILTLGYYPLLSLSKIFGFEIENTLSECIRIKPIIKVESYIIIPLYHPASQIRKEKQLKQYDKIWKNL